MRQIDRHKISGVSSMKFYGSSKQIKVIGLIFLGLAVPACAQKLPEIPVAADSYHDCSFIAFDEVDNRTLTKQEQIERMDGDLEDTLNRSEECLREASHTAQQRLKAAGAGAQSGGASQTNDNASPASAQQTDTMQQQQAQVTSAAVSKSAERGPVNGGSHAVCDAVKQGVAGAQDEQEKQHFNALMKEYGCN
jgi:hypothetical protein